MNEENTVFDPTLEAELSHTEEIESSETFDSGEGLSEENIPVESSEEMSADEPPESEQSDLSDEREVLRAEIARLKAALDAREREHSRMVGEIGEFSEVFPERTLEDVPAEVWQQVKGGVPLAAAYALYERRSAVHRELVDQVNMKNAGQSSGALTGSGDNNYFSPSEVRRMSASEVKANYKMIIESMKKWN